jgi:hypothetical protein
LAITCLFSSLILTGIRELNNKRYSSTPGSALAGAVWKRPQ